MIKHLSISLIASLLAIPFSLGAGDEKILSNVWHSLDELKKNGGEI